ncbi:MAG: TMEM175 family protein [bacterium]
MLNPDNKDILIASSSRVEAFSDSILAIIMTLMIFNIQIPIVALQNVEAIKTLLLSTSPKILVFAMSFFSIAVFRVKHHHLFHEVENVNSRFLRHNIHFLFRCSLIPFGTGLMAANYTHPMAVATYAAILSMASLIFTFKLEKYVIFKEDVEKGLYKRDVQRLYALRHENQEKLHWIITQFPDMERLSEFRKALVSPALRLLAIPLAFVSIRFPIIIFIVVPILNFFPKQIGKLTDR